jgi:putative transposase
MFSLAKSISWALEQSLKAQLPLLALDRAVAIRRPPPGLVHHSDQGVQYACKEYMDRLRHYRMLASISRPANPYDNATCESFLKTLKREEIYATCYRDFEELNQRLGDFINHYYNGCRLHSALKYCSPEAFESACEMDRETPSASAIVTFFQR